MISSISWSCKTESLCPLNICIWPMHLYECMCKRIMSVHTSMEVHCLYECVSLAVFVNVSVSVCVYEYLWVCACMGVCYLCEFVYTWVCTHLCESLCVCKVFVTVCLHGVHSACDCGCLIVFMSVHLYVSVCSPVWMCVCEVSVFSGT